MTAKLTVKIFMKTDQNGWPYYDKLPDEYRLATINDFILNGRLNLRMEFLIKRVQTEHYDVYNVSANLKSTFLIPFITDQRVFVKK
jgi:hypothetical protein